MTDPDAHDYIKRAQTALEIAETDLDSIAAIGRNSIVKLPVEVGLAHTEARIRLGRAWADLASRRIAAGPPLHSFADLDVTGPHPEEG